MVSAENVEETQKTRCILSTSNLLKKKGLKFYQTRSNAIILHDTLPVCCHLKAIMIRCGEVKNEKVYASTSSRDFKTIGWNIGIQKLLERMKTPDKSSTVTVLKVMWELKSRHVEPFCKSGELLVQSSPPRTPELLPPSLRWTCWGSVTVHPRAKHSSEKCNFSRGTRARHP